MTSQQVDTVVHVLAAGGSQRAAAQVVGCAPSSIQKLLRRDPSVLRRVKAEQTHIRSNEKSRQRRVAAKIRANDPDYPGPGSRPEVDSVRRAAASDQTSAPPLESLPGYDATPRRHRSSGGGGRLVPFSGGSIFDGPVASGLSSGPSGSRWLPRPITTEELDANDRRVTVRVGSTTFRVDPRSEDYADYVAAGIAPAIPLP